jgi:hypothetical protein
MMAIFFYFLMPHELSGFEAKQEMLLKLAGRSAGAAMGRFQNMDLYIYCDSFNDVARASDY